MAHQSLYRRYRPRRFGEVRGQDHVVRALRNAVRGGTEGHAYLFSGPRGTGKTSTARILAKALNCEDLQDGEPCCECSACTEIEAGRSFDLFELDAASNNGVDAIRDLVERAAVGSPGRTKVYILDEVHMLTVMASNALLKTLEEPPEHVCFVLATTDPHKVLPTIRSRTQHYEFQLLSAHELTDYVRWIAQDAPLDIDDESVAYVVRQGKGSARDTLSALDQVVAAGGVTTRETPVDQLLTALAERSSGAAVLAVSDALALGQDPRVLADSLLAELRGAFLLSLGVDVPHLVDADAERLGEWGRTLGTPTLTKAMEAVGSARVDMGQAADPRVPLEVALVRLCSTDSASTPAAAAAGSGSADGAVIAQLIGRIDALEAALANGDGAAKAARNSRPAAPAAHAGPAQPGPAAAASVDEVSAGDGDGASAAGSESAASAGDGPARARAALGALRKNKAESAAAAPAASTTASSTTAPSPAAPKRPSAPPKQPSKRPQVPTAGDVPAPGQVSTSTQDGSPGVAPDATAGQSAAVRQCAAAPRPVDSDSSAGAANAPGPDRDALALAFGDVVMPQLKGMAKAIYSAGRFVSVGPSGAVFALENAPTVERAERFRSEVEGELSQHFGTSVTLVLVDGTDPNALAEAGSEPAEGAAPAVGAAPPVPSTGVPASRSEPNPGDTVTAGELDSGGAPASVTGSSLADGTAVAGGAAVAEDTVAGDAADDDTVADDTVDDDESAIIDVHELEDADVAATGMDKLTKAFPGAVLLDGAEGP